VGSGKEGSQIVIIMRSDQRMEAWTLGVEEGWRVGGMEEGVVLSIKELGTSGKEK